MRQPIQLATPDRLQIREGGGCLSAFGLPFFAAGLFLILAIAGVIPMDNATPSSRCCTHTRRRRRR